MLPGQVALITGGGRGLGRAYALALAKAGMRIAIAARTVADLAEVEAAIDSEGGVCKAHACDVSRYDDVCRMVARVEESLGPVDLLINNAGTGGAFGPAWQADPAEWWSALEVNLRGTFHCCHAVLPAMIARGSGRIINVASGAGTIAIPYMSAYVTSKTAVIRFTEVLAAEVAGHGIQAFAIQPGTVRTRLVDDLVASEAGRKWLPWFQSMIEAGHDVGPEHAVGLVQLLASGAADELSGRYFEVPEDDPIAVVAKAEEVKKRDLYTLRVGRLR